MNNALEMRMLGVQQSLMAHYNGGMSMPNASKGDERETFLRDYLQALFPAYNRFSSGSIIDSYGMQTGQIDITVEQPFSPSFPMPGNDSTRLLLAESIAAAIEVKSNASSHWDEVCRTVSKVKALERNYGATMSIGGPSLRIIPCVVVGYKGFPNIETIQKKLAATLESDKPDAVLCIESGAFVGPTNTAMGWRGIYALCALLNDYMRGLFYASFDMYQYLDDVQRNY